jgi:hypothetical protein
MTAYNANYMMAEYNANYTTAERGYVDHFGSCQIFNNMSSKVNLTATFWVTCYTKLATVAICPPRAQS